MKISQLVVYPVKSLQGISVEQSEVGAHGLAWDRCWMLVDAQQSFITQRQLPALATIKVALTAQALILDHPAAGTIAIPLEATDNQLLTVKVWKDHCQAYAESEDVSRWLENALGEQAKGLQLVRFAREFRRPVKPDQLPDGTAHTYFADAYPFLITTTGSLAALNRALAEKKVAAVPMNRFRPNIVIECDVPWAEDRWHALTSLDSGFSLVPQEACKRCKITTIDQQSAAIPTPAEPLKTLIELATQPGEKGGFFGQNATLASGEGATIRVGDTLQARTADSA